MRIVLTLSLIAACSAPPDEPEAPAATDDVLAADALLVHLEALDAIAREHDGNRAVGTSGYEASVVYAEGWLADLGLEVRREEVPVRDYGVDTAALTIDDDELVPNRDFAVLTWSGSGTASGTVVPVDITLPAPPDANSTDSGCEASDFADFPTGAIALVQRGTCTFATKVGHAEDAGAAAVILFNEGQPGRTSAFDGGLDEADAPGIPVLSVSTGDGELLAEGAVVTLEVVTDISTTLTWNVLADLPGTSGLWWSIGGHLDSVFAGPGINDNGTGVSLILQVAERLAGTRPTHGVRLSLWGAEEVGLVGSLAHAAALTDEDGVLGNLNFDMVGSPNPVRFVYDGDGSDFPPALALDPETAVIEADFLDHFDARGVPTRPTGFEGRTDYVGFAQRGLPVGGLFTGAELPASRDEAVDFDIKAGEPYDACYHRSCDTIDNVDLDMLEEMTRAAADVLGRRIAADLGSARIAAPELLAPGGLPTRTQGGCADAHEVAVLR